MPEKREEYVVGQLRLRRTDLQWRAVEGEIVALDVRGSQYLGVNDSGAQLWDLLAAGTTRAALAEHLSATYGLDPATAGAHAEAFVDQLRAQDLVEESD
ncbi:MAG: PqqD family protein [Mycobacteriales bacterium]